MIQSVELRNFKSIKKKQFPLRKLNLLLGLNGMGKSSFIQSLLCLRQSYSNLNNQLSLNNQRYVTLGNTKDVLYQYSKGEQLYFNLNFSNEKTLELELKYQPEADFFSVNNNNQQDRNSALQDLIREPLFSGNFQYLNANRTEPTSIIPKNYSSVVTEKNIGNHGEFTGHFIEVYNGDDIEFENLLHKSSSIIDPVTGKEVINKTLINQINLWMGEISPNVNVRTTSISSDHILIEYVFKQPNFGNTNRFKPENVGFGITYGLPVVVSLLAARPGELIIIENPESHIHPRGQAELGRLIALTAMNDVQIIIETHSDNIINGIRVAIKENSNLKDDTIMFFFEKEITESEQYSKITDIKIDKNGELSEYPKNMLEEWNNQLFNLM